MTSLHHHLQVHVQGVGLYGPGLHGWNQARAILAGQAGLLDSELKLPVPEALPPAERRRVGVTLKLAMACGFDALGQAGMAARDLLAVFSSTGADCDNCHQILTSLASADRAVSPTRFHNSVHNMPAGYWSIATGCMAPSTSLCAHDGSFAAGLIEVATQVRCAQRPGLLLAYDTPYPQPLQALRPIPHSFGIGLVLSPVRTASTLATLGLRLGTEAVSTMPDGALESMRAQVPTARGLPMLAHLARGEAGSVVLAYLDDLSLTVDIEP
jgi:hypothetical protein